MLAAAVLGERLDSMILKFFPKKILRDSTAAAAAGGWCWPEDGAGMKVMEPSLRSSAERTAQTFPFLPPPPPSKDPCKNNWARLMVPVPRRSTHRVIYCVQRGPESSAAVTREPGGSGSFWAEGSLMEAQP